MDSSIYHEVGSSLAIFEEYHERMGIVVIDVAFLNMKIFHMFCAYA
jgi:hypothetical protein